MTRLSCLLRAALVIVAVTPGVGQAQHAQWQVGSTPSFSSGRYGTDTRTDVLYTPITARRLFRDGDVTLVFPFTCIRGEGSVTVINGLPVRRDGSDRRIGRQGAASAGPTTACGMGDVIARGRYYVLDERGWIPTVAVRGHLKAPTASAEQGLGTGRFDEGVGVEISRSVGGGVLLMADGGYTIVGEPVGVEFDNAWWYDVGVGKDLAGQRLNLSVFFEEYSAIVPGLPTARDVLTALTIRSGAGWGLQVSAQFGLSDGAPDHGISIGASRRFF